MIVSSGRTVFNFPLHVNNLIRGLNVHTLSYAYFPLFCAPCKNHTI